MAAGRPKRPTADDDDDWLRAIPPTQLGHVSDLDGDSIEPPQIWLPDADAPGGYSLTAIERQRPRLGFQP